MDEERLRSESNGVGGSGLVFVATSFAFTVATNTTILRVGFILRILGTNHPDAPVLAGLVCCHLFGACGNIVGRSDYPWGTSPAHALKSANMRGVIVIALMLYLGATRVRNALKCSRFFR